MRSAHWLVAPGRPAAALDQAWDGSAPARRHQLAHLPQTGFDRLLWASDLNLVRGEDSLVRALWAGQAFVWHIYPQHDDAHHLKLEAFLDRLQAPHSLRAFHRVWNGLEGSAAAGRPACLARMHAGRARSAAAAAGPGQPALGFVGEKAKNQGLLSIALPGGAPCSTEQRAY